MQLANSGNASAQFKVAEIYANGGDVPKDISKEEEYYKKAISGGNKKAERALILLYIGNGMTDHWNDIASKIGSIAEGSTWHYGLDSEMLKLAPVYSRALVQQGEYSKREAFDKAVIHIAEQLFQAFRRNGGSGPGFYDLPEIAEYQRALSLVSVLQARKERKAREEAERIAREKAEEEARIAKEKAEEEWRKQKDNPDYKFPLNNDYSVQTALYREIKTGVSLEWVRLHLAHSNFTNVQFKASSHEDYLCPTNITFCDATRIISLDFGSVSEQGVSVLISGQISFAKGDVSDEALIDKYTKEIPDAVVNSSENVSSEGGGFLFGIPMPKTTEKFRTTVFETASSLISVESMKSVVVDMGRYHVDESGKYTGPAGEAMANALRFGDGGGQLDVEMAGKAVAIWVDLNGKCNIPTVTIVDQLLRDASMAAHAGAIQLATEKAKQEAEAAAKQRKQEEAARANDF